MLPHWTQHDVVVNGVQLHYYRTGHGDKRPFVLIHGFSDNGLCWTPTARDLESEYDVIMPDMRAHGLSERVQPDDKVDMAADVAGLIRALGLSRPIIGGHSMGAMITYQLGVRFPELASALILEDPPWWLPRSVPAQPNGQPADDVRFAWAYNLRHQTLEELLVQYRAEHPTWTEEFIRVMCEAKKQLDLTIIAIMTKAMDFPAVNWLTTLPTLTQPMLLFTGNPELGAIVTPEVSAKIRELNSTVTIINVPNVGHLIRFDNYSAFMASLQAFLKQIAARS